VSQEVWTDTPISTAEQTVEIVASPETVWGMVADPSMVPKLYRHVVYCVSAPPGAIAVGSRLNMTTEIDGRRVQQSLELIEVVQNRRLSTKQLAGGLFKTYLSTFILEPSGKGTRLTQKVEFEVAAGYLGKMLSAPVVNTSVRKSILENLTTVKELAELKELFSMSVPRWQSSG
jgi:ligand-binding SRPBCC domain-containing protein